MYYFMTPCCFKGTTAAGVSVRLYSWVQQLLFVATVGALAAAAATAGWRI